MMLVYQLVICGWSVRILVILTVMGLDIKVAYGA
jgi:hypothetical protein